MPNKEWENMLAGQPYRSVDAGLVTLRHRARRLLAQYRDTDPADANKRYTLLQELFGKIGQAVEIEPPFFCDYGSNIYLGENFYANFNCVILDPAEVRIGSNVFLAPGVHIYTAYHPLNPTERNSGYESAAPVWIGDNVWIGGGAIIQPGVRIGENTTIGAGSVVTKDIPANVVAAGVPCRVLRALS
ncbi:MAG: maltose transacetylase [Vampirovibrio sp.]|jgi:maltose O-acetyltransferase|nr:maltose transacetylase [Vampirovibrio sp.]